MQTATSNTAKTRTLDSCFDEIKRQDPGTALTRTALRRLVTSGTIPSVRIGRKYLVNIDNVWLFLRGELVQDLPDPVQQYGTIRRIGV